MQLDTLGTKNGALTRHEDRRWRFQEEEWLFGADVVELGDVVAALCISLRVSFSIVFFFFFLPLEFGGERECERRDTYA